jgi:hypothetical protein
VAASSASVKDHAVLARWKVLSCVLTTCRVFMGHSKPSSPVTTSPNCTPCLKDVVGGGMRSRAKTSPVDRGPILTQ